MAVLVAGCAIPQATKDGFRAATTRVVTYEVIGVGSAQNVTYASDGSGSMAQENGVALPWRHEVDIDETVTAVVSVLAQNAGSGELKCRISADGKVVREAVSHGRAAIASCTAAIPVG